jgi:hypothetical protein
MILAGLSLALGCMVAHTSADEIQWRPVAKKSAQPTAGLQQTSFDKNGSAEPLFRAKHDVAKAQTTTESPPLPPGPPLETPVLTQKDTQPAIPKGQPKVEEIPMPKPLPKDSAPGIPPNPPIILNSPPETTIPGVPHPAGPGVVVGPNGFVQDISCEPDWACGHQTWWQRCFMWDNCCALPHFYARGEYLLWSISNYDLPPLVTATTLTPAQIVALSADPNFQPGALNNPGTLLIFGGGEQESPTYSGGRFTLGFGDLFRTNLGFEVTYFFLGERGQHFITESDPTGQPGLYSPFFDGAGNPQSLFIAFPTLLKGGVAIENTSRLWGIEANFRKPLLCECQHRLDLLAGFRFVELNESLTITRFNECIPEECAFITGVITDHFGTRNRFYGGQIGLDYEYQHNRMTIGVMGKVALGTMRQTVLINGSTVTTPGANVPSSNTGLLAQASNSGRHQSSQFAVVPEVGVKLGYQLTDNVTAYVGYSVLYLSNVVRPGDQVDLTIAPPGRPAVPFRTTDFWAHGVNFGLEWKY